MTSPVIQLERGCPNVGGCACLGICRELIDVVPAADYWRVVGERDEARRSVVIELEADATGEERDDELVQRDALLRCTSDELLVQGRRAADEDAAVGGHGANDSAYAIDTGDSACDSKPMTETTTKDFDAMQRIALRVFKRAGLTDAAAAEEALSWAYSADAILRDRLEEADAIANSQEGA